ncbi:hypothetical protein HHX47_DHR3001219, partial [Lentinula edodes]
YRNKAEIKTSARYKRAPRITKFSPSPPSSTNFHKPTNLIFPHYPQCSPTLRLPSLRPTVAVTAVAAPLLADASQADASVESPAN